MKTRAWTRLVLLAVFALSAPAVEAQRHDDIIDVAKGAGQFGTLLAALDETMRQMSWGMNQ